jgi:N-methylhydantoinase A
MGRHVRDNLKPGQTLVDPAMIDVETTTVVINDGDELSVKPLV